MSKQSLDIEELKTKGLVHLAELLESDSSEEKEEDEVEFDDDEKSEKKDDEESKDEKKEVKESEFDIAVAGLEIQETDREKMKAVFESAVEERVAEKLAVLEAKVELSLQEQQEANDKHIANYLDFVVEGWVNDNQVAIANQVKVDLAESFLSKLKGMFSEFDVILESDETIDEIKEAQLEAKSAQDELQEAVAALADQKKLVFALKLENVMAELTEGMTDTQAERFMKLAEEVDVEISEGIEAAKEKLQGVKDVLVAEDVVSESEETIDLEVETQEQKEIVESAAKPVLNEKMASYVAAVRKSFSAHKL